jgi:hypothetical protein
LADFGLSKVIDHRGFSSKARYLAPEIVWDGHDTDAAYEALENQVNAMPNLTKETDVYAFSMVTLEVSDPTSRVPGDARGEATSGLSFDDL